jgi:hypothetical protein
MKKIIVMFLLSIFLLPITYAKYTLSDKDKLLTKSIANKISNDVNNKTPRLKTAWEMKFKNILKNKKTGSKSYELLSDILKYHMKMDLSTFNKKQYSTLNIKQTSIEKYWLNLHNNIRKNS